MEAQSKPIAELSGVPVVLKPVKTESAATKLKPVVEFRHVTKTFNAGQRDEYTAIKDVTFVVDDIMDLGEFICILGASGCGKSTILRLIAGLEPHHPPTAGSVLVKTTGQNGEEKIEPVSAPGADRGMVFQDYTSFPHLSVLDNVAFGLQLRGVPKRERREQAGEWVKKVGLAGHEYKYPHELSGGMKQRVALARTLILKPRIILMDEPFGALDPSTRYAMQELLVNLWRELEPTVFLVTHSISEAVYLGDRIYLMSHAPGTVVEEVEVPRPTEPPIVMESKTEFKEIVSAIRFKIHKMDREHVVINKDKQDRQD